MFAYRAVQSRPAEDYWETCKPAKSKKSKAAAPTKESKPSKAAKPEPKAKAKAKAKAAAKDGKKEEKPKPKPKAAPKPETKMDDKAVVHLFLASFDFPRFVYVLTSVCGVSSVQLSDFYLF